MIAMSATDTMQPPITRSGQRASSSPNCSLSGLGLYRCSIASSVGAVMEELF
jgi:hypothetical protein